ncbi:Type IV pilus biogenesis factor PilY1 [Thalassocella blandensis]|nr:Type IV pilus biogenesis factor PilY1 [Thalassocella blandensis]
MLLHKKLKKTILAVLAVAGASAGLNVHAQSMASYSSVPVTVSESTSPLVMLVMSRDNQLWYKAYNDYSDLDGDGVLDTTYNDNFDYYGYFNSNFCYDYAHGKFSPNSPTESGHKCLVSSNGEWSGNFLNWLTTTRIDVVRKVLYGGYRSLDSADSTVLQRAMIPTDNHAFVKVVYDPNIVSDYTPITNAGTAVSFCNVTDALNGVAGSLDITSNLPKLKIAIGEHETWSGSSAKQCLYEDEGGDGNFVPYRPGDHGTPWISGSGIPSNGELNVRVDVCVKGKDADDATSCRKYGADPTNPSKGVFKPFGLLQTYGETGQYRFGLMTGSYEKNISGGVLRKNVTLMGGDDAAASDQEIDMSTGRFINQNATDFGIIKTLNALRIQGWNFSTGMYEDCNYPAIPVDDFVDAGPPGPRPPSAPDWWRDGTAVDDCRDWGNPISEIYIEALRYFSGDNVNASPDFFANDSFINGLSAIQNWNTPFNAQTECSNCSIIVLSTGLNSFDGDSNVGDSLPNLGGRSIDYFTRIVGFDSGIGGPDDAGLSYIIGNANSGGEANECDAKTLTDLSSASGVCPEIPAQRGTYKIAGAAYFAHENDLNPDQDGKQSVKTYTVQLAESIPSFELTSDSGNTIEFVPTCRSHLYNWAPPEFPATYVNSSAPGDKTPWGSCSLVDLKIREQSEFYGRFMVIWEDSPWGSDYDQDAVIMYEYCTASGSEAEVQAKCPNYTTDSNSDFGSGSDNDSWGFGGEKTERPLNGYDYTAHQRFPRWNQALNDQVQIRMSFLGASAGFAMRFGYTMNGAADSSGLPSGVHGNGAYIDEIVRYGSYDGRAVPIGGNDNIIIWNKTNPGNPRAKKFRAVEGAPGKLENPLWLAAKYGNFTDLSSPDSPGDGFPKLSSEWDKLDSDGNYVEGGDGEPDAYFPIKNPAKLPAALQRIFSNVSRRISSGGSTALTPLSGAGESVFYQSLYTPKLEHPKTGETVEWFGDVHGILMDDQGRFRADSDGNGALSTRSADQTLNDKILEFNFDEGSNETIIRAYFATADDSKGPLDSDSPFTFTSDAFKPLWSAATKLGELAVEASKPGREQLITENRANYSDPAHSKRYIFTAFDRDEPGNAGYGIVGNGSDLRHVPFEANQFVARRGGGGGADRHNYEYLAVDWYETEDLINFIRGKEGINGYRKRSLDLNSDGDISASEYHILGDIVQSSAVVVGKPDQGYDYSFVDDTYADYVSAAADRRQVLYVGSNDGMLHAFNAGKYNHSTKSFDLSDVHALGSELWAYVPYNLLPHLQWLKDPNYSHVYYVDGAVQAFDVNIFADSAQHPGGWGTIIVAGMRFGGGDFDFSHDGDTRTTRSAYVIMDVTNPDQAPELIAEITHPDLGFTVSKPAIMKKRVKSGSSYTDKWYLVFGNGPGGSDGASRRAAIDSAVTTKDARIFIYDLQNKSLTSQVLTHNGAAEANSFLGDITVVDWNQDYIDDTLYVGLVGGDTTTPTGKLKRASIAFNADSTVSLEFADLYNENNVPFSLKPFAQRVDGKNWVYAGSGRFYVAEDNLTSQQQYFYGIKDPGVAAVEYPIANAKLVNTTSITTKSDGRLTNSGLSVSPPQLLTDDGITQDTFETFESLKGLVAKKSGWYFKYKDPDDYFGEAIPPVDSARLRTITTPALAGASIIVGAYKGTGELCEAEGSSYLFAPHFEAGIPAPFAPLGSDGDTSIPVLDLGPGVIGDIHIIPGSSSGGASSGGASSGGASSGGTSSGGTGSSSSGGGSECVSEDYTGIGGGSTGEPGETPIGGGCLNTGRSGWREIPVTW